MRKGQPSGGQQREFLYVFASKPSRSQATENRETTPSAPVRRISNEEARAVREKLIAELRKFGC